MVKTSKWRFLWVILVVLVWVGLRLPVVQAQEVVSGPFRVYLTFEDGPTDAYTPQILDTLAQYHAQASFLIAGYQIAGHEVLLQREIREGHAIVNHLWVEPDYYAGSPDDRIREAYLRTEAAIREALGPELPRYEAQVKMFWQPGGGTRPLPPIDGVQVITYNWNVDSDDCGYAMPGVNLENEEFDRAVINNVLNQPVTANQHYNVYDYGDGVIVAFHDINRLTPRVLPTILSELQQAGATFVALPRPGDAVGTMPVVIAAPPADSAGLPGVWMSAVTLQNARLRAEPSLQGDVLATVEVGTRINAVGRANGWIEVEYNGQTGYMRRDLLKVFGPIPNLPGQG